MRLPGGVEISPCGRFSCVVFARLTAYRVARWCSPASPRVAPSCCALVLCPRVAPTTVARAPSRSGSCRRIPPPVHGLRTGTASDRKDVDRVRNGARLAGPCRVVQSHHAPARGAETVRARGHESALDKWAIAKITGVTRPTLHNFIATRGLKAGAWNFRTNGVGTLTWKMTSNGPCAASAQPARNPPYRKAGSAPNSNTCSTKTRRWPPSKSGKPSRVRTVKGKSG